MDDKQRKEIKRIYKEYYSGSSREDTLVKHLAMGPLGQFHRYDPAKGPTPESVIFDLLQARNHAFLLSAKDRRKCRKLIEEKTALGNNMPKELDLALRFLGLV